MSNWFIHANGEIQSWELTAVENQKPYRLYRFLTELEDLVDEIADHQLLLQKLCPLVHRLLHHCNWLQFEYLEPDPNTGWSVLMLYDEPDFPLTIQTVAWLPGQTSPIHNHGTWGLVALLNGKEKNTFWREEDNSSSEIVNLNKVNEITLEAGDIITFSEDMIHQVEALGEEPVVSFNLYGQLKSKKRFEFDLNTQSKKPF